MKTSEGATDVSPLRVWRLSRFRAFVCVRESVRAGKCACAKWMTTYSCCRKRSQDCLAVGASRIASLCKAMGTALQARRVSCTVTLCMTHPV